MKHGSIIYEKFFKFRNRIDQEFPMYENNITHSHINKYFGSKLPRPVPRYYLIKNCCFHFGKKVLDGYFTVNASVATLSATYTDVDSCGFIVATI